MSIISTMSTTTNCHEHGDPIANYNFNFDLNELNDFDLSSTQDVESILNSPCSEHHPTPFTSPSPSSPCETHQPQPQQCEIQLPPIQQPQPQQCEIQLPQPQQCKIQLPRIQIEPTTTTETSQQQQQQQQQQLLQGLEDILREDPDDLIDNFDQQLPVSLPPVSPSPSPSHSESHSSAPYTKAIASKGLKSGACKTSYKTSSSSSSISCSSPHDALIHSLFPSEVLHYQRNEFNEWKKQHDVGKLTAPVQQRLTAMRRKLHSRVHAKNSRHKNQEKEKVKLTEIEHTKLENTKLKQENTQQKSEIELLKQRLRELGQYV